MWNFLKREAVKQLILQVSTAVKDIEEIVESCGALSPFL